MRIEHKTEQRPVEVTVAEQIEKNLESYSGAAVILIPDGDQGMNVMYRSGQAGNGGAWWVAGYNAGADTTMNLGHALRDVKCAVLIAREDVDNILSGTQWLCDGSGH